MTSQNFKQYLSGRFYGTRGEKPVSFCVSAMPLERIPPKSFTPPPQLLYHHSLCKTWICSHYVIKKNKFQDIALSICLKVFFNFENKNPVSFHTSVPAIYVNRISSLSKVFISNCLVLRRRKV